MQVKDPTLFVLRKILLFALIIIYFASVIALGEVKMMFDVFEQTLEQLNKFKSVESSLLYLMHSQFTAFVPLM